MFLITFVVSVLAGAWAGMTRDVPPAVRLAYFVMALAAPMGVMIVISLVLTALGRRGPRR